MFQNKPIKLAYSTLYWIGTNSKFMKVAAGHTFQFEIKASPNFYLHWSIPLFTPAKENYLMKLLIMKNPARKGGANNNWSNNVPGIAALALSPRDVAAGPPAFPITRLTSCGKNFEYQKCRQGPK